MDDSTDEFADDPIMQELRDIRAKQLAAFGGDFRAMMEDTRQRQYLSGRDLYGRSRVTGRIELVYKGSGKPGVAGHWVGAESP